MSQGAVREEFLEGGSLAIRVGSCDIEVGGCGNFAEGGKNG